MAKLTILTESELERNPQLHEIAKPVTNLDSSINQLISDMFETMEGIGIGLAAPQIGALIRVFVMNMPYLMSRDKGDIISSSVPIDELEGAFINPVIKHFSEEKSELNEGCLSIPGQEDDSDRSQRYLITRPITIEAEYYDRNFKPQTLKVTGLTAKCFQHELDHLNGITLLNRVEGVTEWQKEEL